MNETLPETISHSLESARVENKKNKENWCKWSPNLLRNPTSAILQPSNSTPKKTLEQTISNSSESTGFGKETY